MRLPLPPATVPLHPRSLVAGSRASGLLFLLAVCATGNLKGQCPDGTPPPCAVRPYHAPAPPPNSLAVLYFDNRSRDTASAYLADGLTDELIIRLSRVQRLQVRSRFESERLRGRPASDPRALGRAIGAAYLVTGSLQQSGQRVRLEVALVRAANGATVWGDIYDRTGADLLQIQSDIASAVAGAIVGQLLPDERVSLERRPTNDPLAYQLFLAGIGAANTTNEPGLRAALEFFDRAVARDSAFALALAWKAAVWVQLSDGYVEGRVGYVRAREAAQQALRRDSSLAIAYAMLSQATVALDLDAASGIALGERAVKLDPHQSWSHEALQSALLLAGLADSSVREGLRAWQEDTLSEVAAVICVWTGYMAGETDSVVAVFPRMRAALDPEDIRILEGLVDVAHGRYARPAEQLSWRFYGGIAAGEQVQALTALGRRDAARAVTDSMVQYARGAYYNAYAVAKAYAALGAADSAFAWLERAHGQRTIWLTAVALDPGFAPLHADPRWPAFLRRIGVTR
ncbi:MAG TPA: hypothetical protein VMF70_14495 [Gemmatimonadales bacterium]|nr:hypothetical protein [Gemmatimonadales bacterium]